MHGRNAWTWFAGPSNGTIGAPLTTLKGRDQVRRSWTDRDSTTWEVESYDGESDSDPLSRERWIEFRPTFGEPGIVAPYVLATPAEDLSKSW